jgi:hypothetical protein
MLEAQRREHARRWVRTGLRIRDDVIDLSGRHRMLDEGPGGRGPEALTPERRGDFVADLDRPVDRPADEAPGAEQAPGRGIDEEVHRPRVVFLRRVPEMRQREADGFWELRPAVRHG